MKFKLNSKPILTTLNIVISPHLTSPEEEPILTFPKGRNRLLCI